MRKTKFLIPASFSLCFVLTLSLIFSFLKHGKNGVWLQSWSSDEMMQCLPIRQLLKTPLQSLWYLHIQPPLLDAIRACIAFFHRSAPELELLKRVDLTMYGFQAVLAGISGVILVRWAKELVGPVFALLFLVFWAFHPSLLFCATLLEGTLLSSVLILALLYEIRLAAEKKSSGFRIILWTTLLLYCRTVFQWYFLPVLAASLVLQGMARRRVVAIVGLSFLLFLPLMAKQRILFGTFSTTTYAGYFKVGVLWHEPTREERSRARLGLKYEYPAAADLFNGGKKLNSADTVYDNLVLSKIAGQRWRDHFVESLDSVTDSIALNFQSLWRPTSAFTENSLIERLPWRGIYQFFFGGWIFRLVLIASILSWATRVGIRSWNRARWGRFVGAMLPIAYILSLVLLCNRSTWTEAVRLKFFLEPLTYLFMAVELHYRLNDRQRRHLPYFLLLGVSLFALPARLILMKGDFFIDEVRHNLSVLKTAGFFDLRELIAREYQPIFDYLARKWFWLPVTGLNEFGFRVPNLICSYSSVLCAGFFSFGFFSRSLGRLTATLAAAVVMLWWAFLPIELEYSAEARHYSFVSLISLTWFYLWMRSGLPQIRSRAMVLFASLSLVFCLSHLFAFPLVIFAFGSGLYRFWKEGRRSEATEGAGLCLGLVAISIWASFPSLLALIHNPPISPVSEIALANQVVRFVEGIGLAWKFLSELNLATLGGLLVGAGIVMGLRLARSEVWEQGRRIFMIAVLTILPVFVWSRLRTDYAFSSRYFAPFLGFGFCLVLLGLSSILSLVQGRGKVAAVLVFAGVALVHGTDRAFLDGAWDLPHGNFSESAKGFTWLAPRQGMAVISDRCIAQDLVEAYWRILEGNPLRAPVGLPQYFSEFGGICGRKDQGGSRRTGEFLGKFLKETPDPVIAFIPLFVRCKKDWDLGDLPARVKVEQREIGGGCLWKVRGLTRLEEVVKVANAIGFGLKFYPAPGI